MALGSPNLDPVSMGKKRDENEIRVPTFLKQWRDYRDLTQEKLAERVGVSTSAISQWESGQLGFRAASLAKLAEVLDCTLPELLAYDPTREESFWPLFQKAEKLDGPVRKHIWQIMKAALEPPTTE